MVLGEMPLKVGSPYVKLPRVAKKYEAAAAIRGE